MRSVVMDSNAVDPMADLPGAYEVVRAAVDEGRVEIVFPHVTVDELAATPDLERRRRLLLVLISLGRLVPTGAFVLGESRLGYARLGDDTFTLDALRSDKAKHTRDALIGITAHFEQCTLVTRDDRLATAARDHNIEVVAPLDFLADLGFSSS